jgi:PE-PPE domain
VARLKLLIAATIVAGVLIAPLAYAETRIVVPGASPLPEPLNTLLGGLTPAQYDALNLQIGANWLPGTTPEVVDYPATGGPLWGLTAPTANESIAIGQADLNTAIMNAVADGNPVVVAGLSEGTFVTDHEEAYLATDPDAPPPNEVTFVEFADPGRGVASLLPPETYIPFFGFTTQSIVASQYNTIVVYTEYDGWPDFPDRPWDLIADANAIIGATYLHTPTALAYQSEAVEVSSTTDSLGGTTTTYMIPTQQLPLTQPLLDLGVPTSITNEIDSVLRPIVDAGYSSLTPNDGPYISQGQLVFPEPAFSAGATAPAAPADSGVDPFADLFDTNAVTVGLDHALPLGGLGADLGSILSGLIP